MDKQSNSKGVISIKDIIDFIEDEREKKRESHLSSMYAEDFLKENELWDKFINYAEEKEKREHVNDPWECID